jgi:hypothetical protein
VKELPGWYTCRNPDGIELHIRKTDLIPHDPMTFTVFLDRVTCEQLEKSIKEAKRKFWEKPKEKRKRR